MKLRLYSFIVLLAAAAGCGVFPPSAPPRLAAALTAADSPAGPPPTIRISYIMRVHFLCRGRSNAHSLDFLSSMELVTTVTELNAMAAPAMIGLSRPKAATGMPIML